MRSLAYFLASSFLAGSLHPYAGHFIAEHYSLNENNTPRAKLNDKKRGNIPSKLLPQDTYSYYGFLLWTVELFHLECRLP